ncbi:MAG TPA: glycosyltransferase family 39 protein [Patescibacteria group bacterium]|nr:glycosyltransferase family 39 protein [Patescibacteria group bacterium]
MLKKNLSKIILAIILAFAAITRLLLLGNVPSAITGDELFYILTIKSVALTGHAFNSSWNILPILFFKYPTPHVQAELPYLLLYPIISIAPFSLLTSKITYALLSIATVFVIYLLGEKLFDKRTGLIAAAIGAINPWLFFIGRTSYEVVPATFFYLLGIYLLLREKGNKILYSFPIFVLAFYSYIGTKVCLVPIVLVTSVYAWYINKRKNTSKYAVLNLLCILFLLFFATSLSGNARTSDLVTPFSPEIASHVDNIRKVSIAPNIIGSLLNNKFTVFANIEIIKTIKAFSFDYLFFTGDNFVSLYTHGLLYFVDLFFVTIGVMYLFVENRKKLLFIAGLMFAGVLPQIMFNSNEIFSPHLSLFLVFLIIPIAFGISKVTERYKNIFVSIVILGIYTLSFINFLNIYFFQFPLRGHFDFPSRELSYYVKIASQKSPVDLYVKSPVDAFSKYVYYTNALNKNNYSAIERAFTNKDYKLGNVTFLSCPDIMNEKSKTNVVIYNNGECPPIENSLPSLKISALLDGGEIYQIYNDKFCHNYALNTYPSHIKLSDFNVESLTQQKFCQTFISR